MKRTIRGKYMLLISGLVGIMVLVICLTNSLYLERYYIAERTKDMVETYEEINTILESGSLREERTYLKVLRLLEKTNISGLIGSETQGTYQIFGYENQLEQQMRELAYGKGMESAKLVKQADSYVIFHQNDEKLQTSYILFFGFFSDGGVCFLRSSLPGIRESVMISTRFAWLIGLGVIAVSIILVSLVSKQISGPISRLSHIADRMAHLDFSVRYEENREDEIGLLGTSMNYMAEELEKKIGDLRRVNHQLKLDIEEKVQVDEMRKEFISNVSHELKTPIALIQGYAEGLLEGISEDPESVGYYCEVIIDEAGKMNQLVRKLLTLNQIESGINTAETVDFDLIPVISGVLHSFNIVLQQKGIGMEFDSDKSVIIRADEFMMEEVIRNYVSNAINHIDGEKQIRICTEQDADHVRVSVYNTGPPIPGSELENIWKKFYKVDKARTREYGGSGIGLSIVKAVMDAHNGSCGVKNTEDGVCFWFELRKMELPAVIPIARVYGLTTVREEPAQDEGEKR